MFRIFAGRKPDVTPAQTLAIAGWVVAQLVAYGVLPQKYQQLAVSIGATVLAAAWKWADAHLRSSRVLAEELGGPAAVVVHQAPSTAVASGSIPVPPPPGGATS